MNHGEYVTLPSRPSAGLVPRGLTGHTFASGRTEWQVSKGDLVHAHWLHIRTARYFREHLGSSTEALALVLADAAEVRRLLTRRHPIRSTLPLLREKA